MESEDENEVDTGEKGAIMPSTSSNLSLQMGSTSAVCRAERAGKPKPRGRPTNKGEKGEARGSSRGPPNPTDTPLFATHDREAMAAAMSLGMAVLCSTKEGAGAAAAGAAGAARAAGAAPSEGICKPAQQCMAVSSVGKEVCAKGKGVPNTLASPLKCSGGVEGNLPPQSSSMGGREAGPRRPSLCPYHRVPQALPVSTRRG